MTLSPEMLIASAGVIIAAASYLNSRKAVEIANARDLRESERWSSEKSARLRMVEVFTGINYENSPEDALRYQVAIRNEGRDGAFDLSVGLFFHQTGFRSHGTTAVQSLDDSTGELSKIPFPTVMPTGAIWVFRFEAIKRDFGEKAPRKITILLRWRDGLGQHQARWGMVHTGELGPGKFGGASPAEVIVDGKFIEPRNSMLEGLVAANPHQEYVE